MNLSYRVLLFTRARKEPLLSVYLHFQVAQPWKLNSLLPIGYVAVPGRLLLHYPIPFERFVGFSHG